MAERSIIDQLDDAVTALFAEREPAVEDGELAELVAVARELRGLPSEQFRATLKQQLGGTDNMSTAATSESKSFKRAGFHTITPYLMVKPAVELVDFVKQAFGALESLLQASIRAPLQCTFTFRMWTRFMPVQSRPAQLP